MPLDFLEEVSRANFFVGANNSGKSRLLRWLASMNVLKAYEGRESLAKIQNLRQLVSLLTEQERRAIDDWWKIFLRENNHIRKNTNDPRVLGSLLDAWVQGAIDDKIGKSEPHSNLSSMLTAGHKLLKAEEVAKIPRLRELFELIMEVLAIREAIVTLNASVYVPALRHAGAFRPEDRTVPIATTHGDNTRQDLLSSIVRLNYFMDDPKDPERKAPEIFTGVRTPHRLTELSHAQTAERDKLLPLRRFLSKYFFEGREVELTSELGQNSISTSIRLTVRNGDGTYIERPLHNFGDGIGNLITILFPFFTSPDNAWIFVEEPETFLHPGFERLFVEALAACLEHRKQIRVFFTTHSSHMLGAIREHRIDASIYHFSPQSFDRSTVARLGETSFSLLDSLQVHGSSLLLAGCALWVEGPSDRDYVRAFLHLYFSESGPGRESKRLLEDIHFAIQEYGGSNITHYKLGDDPDLDKLDARSLTFRMLLLADRDTSDPAHSKSKLKEQWKKWETQSEGRLRALITTGKEIENELSSKILAKALPKAFSGRINDALKEKDAAALDASWFESDFTACAFGQFLDEKLGFADKRFAGDSGALKDKDKPTLARTVLDLSREDTIVWEDLSKNAQQLTRHLVRFIQAANYLPVLPVTDDESDATNS
ncbi:MAG: AAA family ATPase [Polyangiaceae bacterium]